MATKTEEIDALVTKYANMYNLDAASVKVILERAKLPDDYVTVAMTEGGLKEEVDLESMEGQIEAATAYIATLDAKRVVDSDDLITTVNKAIPSFDTDGAYARRADVIAAGNTDAYTPVEGVTYTGTSSTPDVTSPIPTTESAYSGVTPTGTAAAPTDATTVGVTSTTSFTPTESTRTVGESVFGFDSGRSDIAPITDGTAFTFGGVYDSLESYSDDVADTQAKLTEDLAVIDARNAELAATTPDISAGIDAKGVALDEGAQATGTATDNLVSDLNYNQELNETSFENTYGRYGLDANDPNNSSAFALNANTQASLNEDIAASVSEAARVRQVRPFSREGIGTMIFGNVYSQGAKETAKDSQYLQESYDNLVKTVQQGYDAARLPSLDKDALKTAYDATLNKIKANTDAKVFDATKDILSFNESAKLVSTLNANEKVGLDVRTKVLELSGKQVDLALSATDLRLKEVDLADKAKARGVKTRADELIEKQRLATLNNTLQQGKITKAEYDAKVKSGAYDTAYLQNMRKASAAQAESEAIRKDNEAKALRDPEVQAKLQQYAAETASVNASSTKTLLVQNETAYKKAVVANAFYSDKNMTSIMRQDQLTLQNSVATLEDQRELIKSGTLDAAKTKQAELQIAQAEEAIKIIEERQVQGYVRLKASNLVKSLDSANFRLDTDAEAESALLDGYKKLLGDPTLSVLPSFIKTDKSLTLPKAIAKFEAAGILDDNPYKAAGLAAELIPSYSSQDLPTTNAWLQSKVGELTNKRIDIEKDSVTIRAELGKYLTGDKVTDSIFEKNNPALGLNPIADVKTLLTTTEKGVEVLSYIDDEAVIADYEKALTAKDKLDVLAKAFSTDTNDKVVIAGRISYFVNANKTSNNNTKKFDIINLPKQTGIYYKVPAQGVIEGAAAVVNATPMRFEPYNVNLTDPGDIVKLMSHGVINLK